MNAHSLCGLCSKQKITAAESQTQPVSLFFIPVDQDQTVGNISSLPCRVSLWASMRLRWTHTRIVQLILDLGFSEVTDFHLWPFQHLNIRFHVQHAEAAQTHGRFGGACVSRVEEQMQSPIISSSCCFHVLLPFLMRPHHYFWQTAAWRQEEAAACRMQWFHNKSSINTKVTPKTPRGAKNKQTFVLESADCCC